MMPSLEVTDIPTQKDRELQGFNGAKRVWDCSSITGGKTWTASSA